MPLWLCMCNKSFTGALCQHTAVCDMYPDPNLDTDLYLDEVYGTVNFTKEVSCFSLFCFYYLLPEILFETLLLKIMFHVI